MRNRSPSPPPMPTPLSALSTQRWAPAPHRHLSGFRSRCPLSETMALILGGPAERPSLASLPGDRTGDTTFARAYDLKLFTTRAARVILSMNLWIPRRPALSSLPRWHRLRRTPGQPARRGQALRAPPRRAQRRPRRTPSRRLRAPEGRASGRGGVTGGERCGGTRPAALQGPGRSLRDSPV